MLVGGGGTPSSHDGGGLPHPVMVGLYPIQSWWWGVPHPVMVVGGGGGTPSSHGGGYPGYSHHPDLDGGVPHPVMVVGEYPIQSWIPWVPPTIQTWMGGTYPPTIQIWDGVPLTIQTWDGVPPYHTDLGWATHPPTIQTWDGVPSLLRPGTGVPPPSTPMVNRQTFPSINITFPRTTHAGGNYV